MNIEKAYQMACHAYTTVPIYCRLVEQMDRTPEQIDFSEFPVVDKSFFAQSAMSTLSSHYISEYLSGKLRYVRTSGSTGKFTEVYWSPEEDRRSLLSLWLLRKKEYGISAKDRMCYFYPSDAGDQRMIEGRYYKGYSKKCIYDGSMSEMYQDLMDYDPVWMILQPSMAVMLCEEAMRCGEIPCSLRYIELTGEYLEPEVRRYVQEIFQCQTANQYGTKEVNSIAYECSAGSMHILSDNVYLETIQSEDAEEICVTTLHNHAMPFVRFNLEDRGSIQRDVQCNCGRCGDLLTLRAGRGNDWIQCADGSRIHAYALMQLVHRVNYQTDGGIRQYQIRQITYDHFDITLVLDEEEDYEMITEELYDRIRHRLGGQTEVSFQLESHILPVEKTGKLACFQSDVK